MTGHTIVTYTANVFEFLLMCLGLTFAYQRKYNVGKTILIWTGSAAVFLVSLLIWDSFHPALLFYWIDFILCGVLYAVCLKGQLMLKTTMAVVYCSAFFIATQILNKIPYPAVFADEMDNSRTFYLIGKGILTVYFAHFSLTSRRKLPVLYWMPVMLISLIMLAGTYHQMISRPQEAAAQSVVFVYCFCLLAVLCILTGVYSSLIRQYEDSVVKIAMSSNVVDSAALLQDNANLSRSMSRMEHEWKNHLASLTALISAGHSDEALNLIRSLNLDRSEPGENNISSGNSLVDVILKRYAELCQEKKIAFRQEAVVGNELAVSPADLSSVLSNLLNNAVEGSEGEQNPEIQVRIFPMKDYLCIRVRNRADMAKIHANPSLFTTKKEPNLHGIGLGVVRSIAEKYKGWMKIDSNDAEWFSVDVALLV